MERKEVIAMNLKLTEEQQKQVQEFWQETGSIGTAEILVDVKGDRISPAAIQVGTAK